LFWVRLIGLGSLVCAAVVGSGVREAASVIDAGTVNVLFGSTTGLSSAAGDEFWHQNKPGVNDRGRGGRRLGCSLVGLR
jgi:hypothetical protein